MKLFEKEVLESLTQCIYINEKGGIRIMSDARLGAAPNECLSNFLEHFRIMVRLSTIPIRLKIGKIIQWLNESGT